jgi:hypothetical protein
VAGPDRGRGMRSGTLRCRLMTCPGWRGSIATRTVSAWRCSWQGCRGWAGFRTASAAARRPRSGTCAKTRCGRRTPGWSTPTISIRSPCYGAAAPCRRPTGGGSRSAAAA